MHPNDTNKAANPLIKNGVAIKPDELDPMKISTACFCTKPPLRRIHYFFTPIQLVL